jgi:hypothetical protein
MEKALKRANRAQKEGNQKAKDIHYREALKHEREMKELDEAAAGIIFKTNKVRRSLRHDTKSWAY